MTWLRHLGRPCFERERVWLAVQSHVSLYWGWLQMTMVGISWLGTLWVAWPGMWGLEKHEYSSCAGHLIVKTRTRTIPHTLVTHMYRSVIRSRHNIIMTIITNNYYQSKCWISNDIIILKFDHFMNHLLRCINDYSFDDPLKGSSDLAPWFTETASTLSRLYFL